MAATSCASRWASAMLPRPPGSSTCRPADEGANVALLRPFDRVVWDRMVTQAKVNFVSPKQVALDCLAGNCRMPAGGEAVLTWRAANDPAWRAQSLAEVEPFGVGAA